MKTSNVQRNEFDAGNTSIARPNIARSTRRLLRLAGLASVAAVAMAISLSTGQTRLQSSISPDQSTSAGAQMQKADLLDDIIDMLGGLLGSGGGGGHP